MVDEIDRDGAPAAPEVEQAPRYVWTATHTPARDATIYRRMIAAHPNSVPLRVWQFCEENGLDVCLFDGVSARAVTDLEETLALAPPHAHAQIRNDGGVLDVAPADPQIDVPAVEAVSVPAPIDLPLPPASGPFSQGMPAAQPEPMNFTVHEGPAPEPAPWIEPAPQPDAPSSEHSSGE